MSTLVGAALPQIIIAESDARIAWEPTPIEAARPMPIARALARALVAPGDFRSPWWPARAAHIGYSDSGAAIDATAVRWEEQPPEEGVMARYAFVGVTRDEYGSPLSGCVVRCFVTGTNEVTEIVTSTLDGSYQVTTPYAETAHFVTTHILAPVERAGATLDTVTPA